MAEIKAIGGSAWGVPVNGTMVSLNNADTKAILNSASGLTKGLFAIGGASALALGLIAAFGSLESKQDYLPFTTLCTAGVIDSEVHGFFGTKVYYKRRFNGICLNKEICIQTDGGKLNIPLEYIKTYRPLICTSGFLKKKTSVHLNITLFDGSEYKGSLIEPTEFEFITAVGKQSIPAHTKHDIFGCTMTQAEKLKLCMTDFLENKHKPAISFIGEKNFNHFFQRV